MKKKVAALVVAAMLAIGVFFAGTASAHWQGRMITGNGAWWAVHYNPFAQSWHSVEFFQSWGNAVNYRVSVYNPSTGEVVCQSTVVNGFGVHYSMSCIYGSVWPIGTNWRCRVVASNTGQSYGFYCREIAGQTAERGKHVPNVASH